MTVSLKYFEIYLILTSSGLTVAKLPRLKSIKSYHSRRCTCHASFKELVGYLIIERLYKEMASLPDSPVQDGKRTIRTILVIDEAHNYLGQKNIFLERIIREGRSKGIVVFFASQSPNDYQQRFFNFQELLEFAYISNVKVFHLVLFKISLAVEKYSKRLTN